MYCSTYLPVFLASQSVQLARVTGLQNASHSRMSLKYRLLRIEQRIPFEDVTESWGSVREDWVRHVIIAAKTASLLAAEVVTLLDALTPSGADSYWSRDAFKAVRADFDSISLGSTPDLLGINLQSMIAEVEKRVEIGKVRVSSTRPPPVEKKGKGRPLVLPLGEDGPALEVGDVCVVLDETSETWYKACVMDVISVPEWSDPLGGKVHYHIHYDGWHRKWDEYVDKEAGRITWDRALS